MKKRIIGGLLIVVLLLGLVPFSVFAETNESKYFSDMGGHSWAIEAVDSLYEIGLVNGVVAPKSNAKGTFNPQDKVTWSEFTTVLSHITKDESSYPSAPGVPVDKWYTDSMNRMYSNDIIEKDAISKECYPSSYVSREECFYCIYYLLTKSCGLKLDGSNLIGKYSDSKYVLTRYYRITDCLLSNHIIVGSNNKINPKAHLTRAEMAVIIKQVIDAAGLKFDKINFVVPNLGRGLTGNGYDGVVSNRKYSDDIITIMTNFVANEVGAVLDKQIGNVRYYNISSLTTFDHPKSPVKANCHDLRYIQACVARNAYEYYGSDSRFRSWVRNYCDSRYDRTTMQLIRGGITKAQWEDCRQDVIWALNNYRFPKGVIVADKMCQSCSRWGVYTEIYVVVELPAFGNNGYSYNPNTKNWAN